MAPMLSAVIVLQTIAFANIAQGPSSQIEEPRTVVVRSVEEWRTLWTAHASTPVPRVDFSKSIVVGVFLGTRPTAGFAVQITAVRRVADGAVVEYVERAPDPSRMVAQVLTSPFHIVTIPGEIKTVEFKRVKAAP
jgi:hypothetical protein